MTTHNDLLAIQFAVPHIGPRCAFCGAVPEEPHSRRCGTVTAGFEHQYVEWPDDIKAERDALRTALTRAVIDLEASSS